MNLWTSDNWFQDDKSKSVCARFIEHGHDFIMAEFKTIVQIPDIQLVTYTLKIANDTIPDSKVHGGNMGPTWVLSAPAGPHVGPWTLLSGMISIEWYICSSANWYIIYWYDVLWTCKNRPIKTSYTPCSQTSFKVVYNCDQFWYAKIFNWKKIKVGGSVILIVSYPHHHHRYVVMLFWW